MIGRHLPAWIHVVIKFRRDRAGHENHERDAPRLPEKYSRVRDCESIQFKGFNHEGHEAHEVLSF